MRIFLAIAALMALVLANFAIGVTSEEASASASVTVNTFVDITLTDAAPSGFSFGSLDPGTTNNKEAAQTDGVSSTLPAATVTRETTSNVDVKVRSKGTNFVVGANTLAVSNVKYDDDGAHTEGAETSLPVTNMATTYPVAAYATLTAGSPSVKIWFWLNVPTGQAAGAYTSTFSFEGNSV